MGLAAVKYLVFSILYLLSARKLRSPLEQLLRWILLGLPLKAASAGSGWCQILQRTSASSTPSGRCTTTRTQARWSSRRRCSRRRRPSWSTMRIVIVRKAASLPLRSSRNVKMTEKNEIRVVEIYVDCYMSRHGICHKWHEWHLSKCSWAGVKFSRTRPRPIRIVGQGYVPSKPRLKWHHWLRTLRY